MSSSYEEDDSRFEELPPSPTSSSSSRFTFEDAQSFPPPSESPSTSTSTSTSTSLPLPPLPLSTPPPPESPLDEDEDEENDDSVWYTTSELRDILDRSTGLKTAGNNAFGKGNWEEALGIYRDGLVELPVRTKTAIVKKKNDDTSSSKGKEKAEDGVEVETEEKEDVKEVELEEQEDPEQEEARELRAILFANVAACLLKLERWKDAVTACDDSLEENPNYIKALSRRATASEAICTWASLTSALEDHKKLLTLPDVSPIVSKTSNAALKRLPGLIATQQEKEKDEVLGKLKDLGNTLLGKFGLSTDNFKFTEQPGGGYSMNFER